MLIEPIHQFYRVTIGTRTAGRLGRGEFLSAGLFEKIRMGVPRGYHRKEDAYENLRQAWKHRGTEL